MKSQLILQILKQIKQNPKLKKKIIIFSSVAVLVIVLLGGVTLWVSIQAVSFLASQTHSAMSKMEANQSHLDSLQDQLPGGVAQFHGLSCLNQVQTLMAVEPWLSKPLASTLQDLKSACFQPVEQSCPDKSECPSDSKPQNIEDSDII